MRIDLDRRSRRVNSGAFILTVHVTEAIEGLILGCEMQYILYETILVHDTERRRKSAPVPMKLPKCANSLSNRCSVDQRQDK